jgi:molybdenum-dependent DNA-binding transcriptional regulator ModE
MARSLDLDQLFEEVRKTAGGSNNPRDLTAALDKLINGIENMSDADKIRLRDAFCSYRLQAVIEEVRNSTEHKKHIKVLGGGKIERRSGRDKAAGAEVEDRNEELFEELNNNQGVA